MRQLVPDQLEVGDLLRFEAALDRSPPSGRPWVLTNMIASADGAIAVDGVSGPLGGPTDRQLFRALRALADVILVGAGTVRHERYRPPAVGDDVVALRRQRGQADRPRLAVVTTSGELDPTLPLFDDPGNRPLLVTPADAPDDARSALADVTELLPAGRGEVDLAAALATLHDSGARTVLAEGGPRLNGHLLAADLVDEWRLTVSPVLVGGGAGRASAGPSADATRFRLERVLAGDDLVFLRYLRR